MEPQSRVANREPPDLSLKTKTHFAFRVRRGGGVAARGTRAAGRAHEARAQQKINLEMENRYDPLRD